jgi:hypothetical protein
MKIKICEGEDLISYSKNNGSQNDFTDNLYDHGLSMFSN